jgi:hypothetical protein
MKKIFDKDSVVVVTGASSGMGEEIALACARQGATVVLIGRNPQHLDYVARKIVASGGRPVFSVADVSKRSDLESVASRIATEHKKIDLLVNAAGVGLLGKIEDTPEQDARRIFDVNYFGILNSVQVFLPLLQKGKNATVVNIASVVGKVGWPGMGVYAASKAAVCSLTDALRIEFKKYGIRIVLVCPGYTKTNFLKNCIQINTHKDEKLLGGGMLPFDVAIAILKGVSRGKKEIIIGNVKEKIILTAYHYCRPVADFLLQKVAG